MDSVLLLTRRYSRGSKAYSGVCVCVSVCVIMCVCPQHNSKTNDPKVLKLGTGYPTKATSGMVFRSKGQRSQDHKVQKHIEGDQVAAA